MRASSSSNSELESYLTTSFEFDKDFQDIKISILQWWKEHSTQFSVIAIIAKQILVMSVPTVVVEQAFSVRGVSWTKTVRVCPPDSMEVQTCLDDWTKITLR